MLFSSIVFLYYFLPILIIAYFITPSACRNYLLLFFSFMFYFYGEPKFGFLIIISALMNYSASKLIVKYPKHKQVFLILAIVYNLGQLVYFKYTGFIFENLNILFNTNWMIPKIIMPIGISFFTFQALSYVVDVYKEDTEPSKNFLDFAMYLSLFPQLIAGPIVRYKDVAKEIQSRTIDFENFSQGLKRFVVGLAKKIILANLLGAWVLSLENLVVQSVLSFWLKAIGFTLQIYFDFSAYSDMAIGLGLMLGFHFLENFNYPLIATSITDFWRRWHMSLSSFFKDYVYIPLGGNRVSKIKYIRNLFVVWFLTGLWHGASWNFIIWGLYFALVLLFEKKYLLNFLNNTKVFKYIYASFFIVIGFAIFNAGSMQEVLLNLKSMFGFNHLDFVSVETLYTLRSNFVLLVVSLIVSTPLLKNLKNKYNKLSFYPYIETIVYPTLLLLCTAYLVDASFNPFLYFRF